MNKVALAIGKASMRWADIEFVLQQSCVKIARFLSDDFTKEETADVLGSTLALMDIRQRIAIAKALAAEVIDPDTYGDIEKLLNYIDNDLRVERNRFIHDQWSYSDRSIVRTKWGARVVRAQSRTIEVHHLTEKHFASAKEVHAFYEKLTETMARLFRMHDDLDAMYRDLRQLEGSA